MGTQVLVYAQPQYFLTAPKLYMNGQEVDMQNVTSSPYVKNFYYCNKTTKDVYVPLKLVCRCIGAKVEFNNTKKVPTIILNDKTIDIENYEIDNGNVMVQLEFLGKALNVEVKYDDYITEINGDFTFIPNKPKVPVKNISEFGNTFIGHYNNQNNIEFYQDKVVIAKRSDLPINLGDIVIYDIYENKKSIIFPLVFSSKHDKIYKNETFPAKSTFTVVSKPPARDNWQWSTPIVYLSCKDGLNRSRRGTDFVTNVGDVEALKRDKNGIITSLHNVISHGDPGGLETNEYKSFTLNKVNYFVIEGQNALLAIPCSEVIKK